MNTTSISKCRHAQCPQLVAFLPHINKAGEATTMPTDAESLSQQDLEDMGYGRLPRFNKEAGHISHFTTCKFAGQFSRKKKFRR